MALLASTVAFSLRADLVPLFLRLSTLLTIITIALSLLRRNPRDKAGNTIPPGPKGLPLLGESILKLIALLSGFNGRLQAYFLTYRSTLSSVCTAGPRPMAPSIRS